jgi:hypothetical protein
VGVQAPSHTQAGLCAADVTLWRQRFVTPATAAFERERMRWDEALVIARDYPVSVEAVRGGLDYVRERAAKDEVQMEDAMVRGIVRAALTHALVIGEPHPQYGLVYEVWLGIRTPPEPNARALAAELGRSCLKEMGAPSKRFAPFRPEPPAGRRGRKR